MRARQVRRPQSRRPLARRRPCPPVAARGSTARQQRPSRTKARGTYTLFIGDCEGQRNDIAQTSASNRHELNQCQETMPLVSGGGLVRTNVRQCVTTDPSESVSESSTSS